MGDGGDEWSNEEYLVQAIIMADDKCIVIVVDLEGPRIIIQGADLGGRWCLKTLEHFCVLGTMKLLIGETFRMLQVVATEGDHSSWAR